LRPNMRDPEGPQSRCGTGFGVGSGRLNTRTRSTGIH
jgi:hypothetical protein